MSDQLYINANFFTADSRPWAHALVVRDERILYVGDEATARSLSPDAAVIDLGGRLALPGFVDGHAHVIGTGEALSQANLWGVEDLAEIRDRLARWKENNPDAPRILAMGWPHGAIPGGQPHRSMLDEQFPDVPVYAVAYDYHSIWLNSAALDEVGITVDTPDPLGGVIHRDETGEATGFVDETAYHGIVAPFLDELADESTNARNLELVQEAYRLTGVTTSCDMGFNEADFQTFLAGERSGRLTSRLKAYWRVNNTGDLQQNLAQVARAAELSETVSSPLLDVVGIKVIIDGTVDGCTAVLGAPYADGSTAEPIWPLDDLAPVVAAADAAGLKVAMHAIGDEAVRIAISAVEEAIRANGPIPRRHRIEHLEVVDRADVERLAALGITPSMQPVHVDPVNAPFWRAQLGDERADHGFPWPWMTEAGARLAFGTDSPTAAHPPLPNMYMAATRRSASAPEVAPNSEELAVPLEQAIVHGSAHSAWTCGAEDEVGRLRSGLFADFIVLDTNVFERPVDELLSTSVVMTVLGGEVVHDAGVREDG
ncbi:amidohydrolase [Brevibacterium sp.]|uniref:amidohydrolase n=1 Tax=Brevibacterium sp. TaxID=1701 RepID=UPI0028127604|nr:amidohydrolase [Brevibacterium sp.]